MRRFGPNGIAILVPSLAALLLTPVLVHGLGPDRYGVWALAGTATAFALTMDFGLAATMVRYAGTARGANDPAAARRLLWTLTSLVSVAGVVLAASGILWGPLILHVLTLPSAAVAQTRAVLPLAGVLIAVPAMVGLWAAFLQGWGDYRSVAMAALSSSFCWVGAVLWLRTKAEWSLRTVLLAYLGSQALSLLVLGIAAFAQVAVPSARWMSRTDLREVGGFARGMQAANLWGFINLEADALIVAAFLPVREVGVYALGAAVATALRQMPLLLLTPLYTRLANESAIRTPALLREEAARLQKQWMCGVGLYAFPAIPLAYVALVAWVGRGHTTSAVIAVILAAGNAVNLGTGVLSSYVRVIGRPEVEARYGAISTVVNLVLTLALVVPAGAIGVAAATAIGQLVGSVAFVALLRGLPHRLPAFWREIRWRSVGVATAWAVVSCTICIRLTDSRWLLVVGMVIATSAAFAVVLVRRRGALSVQGLG